MRRYRRLLAPRLAATALLAGLSGCSSFLSDAGDVFWPFGRDPGRQVDATSYTANRILGRPAETPPLEFGTASGEIDAVIASEPNPDIRQRIQQELDDAARPPGTPPARRGSSTPPSVLNPDAVVPRSPPPPLPRAPAAPPPRAEALPRDPLGQVLNPPGGPPVVLQGRGPVVPYTSPGGAGGTAVNQGGFTTLYGSDGSVRTVPNR